MVNLSSNYQTLLLIVAACLCFAVRSTDAFTATPLFPTATKRSFSKIVVSPPPPSSSCSSCQQQSTSCAKRCGYATTASMASSRHVSLAVQQPYKYNAVALFSTASSDDGASPKTAPHDDDDDDNKESVVGKTESLVENDTSSSATSTTTNTTITTAKLTLRERWARAFPKRKDDDLPMKQKLAKMGLACVLSYGFVSNLNAVITTAIAWFVFAKRTGLSPLAPGQWKPFLAVYTGFWVFNNFIRPIRFAAAVTISPFFDRAVLSFQKRLKVSKPVAIGITVFMTNVVGTTLVLVLGVSAAAALSGTPIFPPKV